MSEAKVHSGINGKDETKGNDVLVSRTSGIMPMVVLFGKPGAGKSTIASEALRLIREEAPRGINSIGLDLDVCVPQRMRDNFARGIYPNLDERTEFAKSICDYVESSFMSERRQTLDYNGQSRGEIQSLASKEGATSRIVSFSFVNNDLRDAFRSRFPEAVWALVDVSDATAEHRINNRIGHFYKSTPLTGAQKKAAEKLKCDEVIDRSMAERSVRAPEGNSVSDNSDWVFAPVAYPHIRLDGEAPIDVNARRVVAAVSSLVPHKS